MRGGGSRRHARRQAARGLCPAGFQDAADRRLSGLSGKRRPQTYTLRIARVYDPPAADGGCRILVDRLWPRGLSRERAALALWARELAPSDGLRRFYGHAAERFADFSARYRAELDANPAAEPFARRLAALLQTQNVTLLFAARDPEHSNAAVLRDWLAARLNQYIQEESFHG
jgi:uncharacterized protein YeaO (DUF488 family)